MNEQGSWDDCPAGVLSDMAGQLQRRKHRAKARHVISVGAAILLLAAIGYGLTSRDESGPRAGLNCRQTVPLLAEYHNQSLDAAVASDVLEHLSHCPKCREYYESLYPSEVRNRSSDEHRVLAVASPLHR